MHDGLSTLTRLAKCGLVIDLDFSRWAERIRLVVAEGNDFQWGPNSSVYNIDFIRPLRCSFAAPTLQADASPSSRWEIWSAEAKERDDCLRITLSGHGPAFEIECRDVRVEWMTDPQLHLLNSQWHKPGPGLVRPSIEDVVGLLVSRGKRPK